MASAFDPHDLSGIGNSAPMVEAFPRRSWVPLDQSAPRQIALEDAVSFRWYGPLGLCISTARRSIRKSSTRLPWAIPSHTEKRGLIADTNRRRGCDRTARTCANIYDMLRTVRDKRYPIAFIVE